jgi:DNA-binding HxlR family transcriptional regulator
VPSLQNELKYARGCERFDSLNKEPAYSKTASVPSMPPYAVSADGLTAFEKEVVAVFVDLVVLLGLPKSVGEIYGLLFASATPLTFTEIEQKLGLSKGSVSQGLRSLREIGAIREAEHDTEIEQPTGEFKTPARVARWEAVVELRQLVGALLSDRLTPYLHSQNTHIERAAACLDELNLGADPVARKILNQRLSKLQTWQTRARTFLPLIGKLI